MRQGRADGENGRRWHNRSSRGISALVRAHELDEYLQAARVSLARDRVVCEIDLTPGAAIAAEIVALVDRDADRLVSPAEAEAYGRAVLSDVRLEVDGRAITMALTRVDVPSVEVMTDGLGTIRLEAIANIDPLAPGRRHVYFATIITAMPPCTWSTRSFQSNVTSWSSVKHAIRGNTRFVWITM